LLTPLLIAGANANCDATTNFCPPLEGNLFSLLVNVLNIVVFFMFPIIVLMVVYTGFLFVAAQGNESKITEARRALVFTLIGALVVLGAKVIAVTICGTVQGLGATVTCSL